MRRSEECGCELKAVTPHEGLVGRSGQIAGDEGGACELKAVTPHEGLVACVEALLPQPLARDSLLPRSQSPAVRGAHRAHGRARGSSGELGGARGSSGELGGARGRSMEIGGGRWRLGRSGELGKVDGDQGRSGEVGGARGRSEEVRTCAEIAISQPSRLTSVGSGDWHL